MLTHFKFNELGNHDYGWLNARYHFNFANYYNPKITPKNPLVVWNDDTINPQTGFPMHSHQNMEIITYIRQGSISHKDNIGNAGEIKSGQIQVMSAGSGITHSEYNLSNEETSLFQIWIEPNQFNIKPRWKNIDLKDEFNEFVEILASGEKKYKNSDTYLKWQCTKGHIWKATYRAIANNKVWCIQCEKDIQFRFGFEYMFSDLFTIRSGIQMKPGKLGFGFTYSPKDAINISYALITDPILPITNNLELNKL